MFLAPRQPPEQSSRREESDEVAPTQQKILDRAEDIAEQVSEIGHPAFSLCREEGCEIHENAFWELQTYLGLHEDLAANEVHAAFSTSPIESGHRLDIIIEHTYATSPSVRFVRCTERQ